MDYATKEVITLWLDYASKNAVDNLEHFTKNLDEIEDKKTKYINNIVHLSKTITSMIHEGAPETSISISLSHYISLLSEMSGCIELLVRHALAGDAARNATLNNIVNHAADRLVDRSQYLSQNKNFNDALSKLNEKIEGIDNETTK